MQFFSLRGSIRGLAVSAAARPADDARLCTRLFWTWLIARTLTWSMIAGLTLPTVSMDVAQMLSWGREWSWGYYKHPPLPAWVAEGAAFLAGGWVGGVYLASYIIIGVCLWAAWRLGREMLSPRAALIAALSLEGLIYYTHIGHDLNHNVLLAGTSALLTLCFYRALRSGRNGWWLGTGVTVGLAMLSKYSSGFLLLPMLLFLALHPAGRACWKRPGPYLAGAAAFLVFLPHLIWCFQHDFSPLRYVLARTAEKKHSWIDHLRFPAYFSLSQCWRLLPVLLLLAPLTGWRWRFRKVAPDQCFNRDFLLAMVLGPVLLHLLTSLALGLEIRDMWGYHLWTFLGVAILFFVQTETNAAARRVAWAGGLAVGASALFMLYTAGQNLFAARLGFAYKTHLPAQSLVREVEQEWRGRYGWPIPIIASDDECLGDIACWYAPGRPLMYMPARPEVTPWVSEDDLNARGGVIIWDARKEGDDLPRGFHGQFPQAMLMPPVVVPYSSAPNLPPLRFGVALVAPRS